MTDLSSVLPNFPTQTYLRLIPSLERNNVTTADLLTLDPVEIAKRAQLPPLDVKRLCNAVLETLQTDLGIVKPIDGASTALSLRKTGKEVVESWKTISTLDEALDRALGGGIPAGYITEITGESGAGKTQFLLTLLLSVQLPPPHGLSAPALYISTESDLPTTRIAQLLASLPTSLTQKPTEKPSLDRIISIKTPDLESQDHILRYQVPVAIRRHGIRLLILDSVAANYRAEFERPGGGGNGGQNMALRSAELVKLGQFLRELAREHGLVVVVANQVADRFSGNGMNASIINTRGRMDDSPLARRSAPASTFAISSTPTHGSGSGNGNDNGNGNAPSSTPFVSTHDPMSLDHQQRFFTGWGDSPLPIHSTNMKTPSLGLIWSTQIAVRIALIKKPVYGPALAGEAEGEDGGDGDGDGDGSGRGELVLRRWRRWMKVVFAPHVGGSGRGVEQAVEFEIRGEGVKSLGREDEEVER